MTEVARASLSVCIITRDEARNLPACLDSVAFADEIVVVDSISRDETREIARARGCRVVEQEFLGHVRQKQLAVDSAAHDWVFCIDADERVDDRLRDAILAVLTGEAGDAAGARDTGNAGCAGYEVNRHTYYLGRFIDHGGWFPEWRLRLFDRRRGRWAGVDPHDHVEVSGATHRLAGELAHYAYRDISHHVTKIDSYTTIMAREKEASGRRCGILDLVFRPPFRFLRMYVLRGGFRDGVRGLVVASLGAFYVFLKYAKLWEREHVTR